MKFFPLDFLNRMNCKNRNGVMLVNIFLKIFSQFFKIWVECPFKLNCYGALRLYHNSVGEQVLVNFRTARLKSYSSRKRCILRKSWF